MKPRSFKILILFAHPALHKSRVNRPLINAAHQVDGVTVHDLYECYPEFDVDVDREQSLLKAHDIIVFHHPLYWYSVPALLKQWMDLVLQYDFAFGTRGTQLQGKALMSAISTGADASLYQHEGLHGQTLAEFLVPIKRTAHLCHMDYLPPFVVSGTHRLEAPELASCASEYCDALEMLRDGRLPRETLTQYEFCNDALASILPNPPTS